MEFISDVLLGAGAIGAGVYCLILGRHLRRFNTLENGVGGAVALLSAQVDDLSKTLKLAQETSENSAETLSDIVDRANQISRSLELQMASLHDLSGSSSIFEERSSGGKTDTSPEVVFLRHGAGGRG